jgi:mono/diheme cytochrome c family protein
MTKRAFLVFLLNSVAPAAVFSEAQMTSTEEQVAAGTALYDSFCARCHGAGMVDPGDGFYDLRTFPADERGRFIESVSNGKNSMPPWRAVLSPEEIESLFAYVIANRAEP